MPFGDPERKAAEPLIRMALAEDLDEAGDLTTRSLIGESDEAIVDVVVRREGVVSGGPIGAMVFSQLDPRVVWQSFVADGTALPGRTVIASVRGPLRSLLTGERTALNFLTHLSGIASLTQRFVQAVSGTEARVLDTRKTHPGFRILEKYAVRCGGGSNHRLGLHDGILIKDNHLAGWSEFHRGATLADAVRHVRSATGGNVPVEVEVDTLAQLEDVLHARPDIVLLDNMTPAELKEAVALRDRSQAATQLEASGGVTLSNVAEIARTGVERISIGALTHSAPALDIAFDWRSRRNAAAE